MIILTSKLACMYYHIGWTGPGWSHCSPMVALRDRIWIALPGTNKLAH